MTGRPEEISLGYDDALGEVIQMMKVHGGFRSGCGETRRSWPAFEFVELRGDTCLPSGRIRFVSVVAVSVSGQVGFLGFGLRPFVFFYAVFGGPCGLTFCLFVWFGPLSWGLYLLSGLALLINLEGKKKQSVLVEFRHVLTHVEISNVALFYSFYQNLSFFFF